MMSGMPRGTPPLARQARAPASDLLPVDVWRRSPPGKLSCESPVDSRKMFPLEDGIMETEGVVHGGSDWAAWTVRGQWGPGMFWTKTVVWECPDGELTQAQLAASAHVSVRVLEQASAVMQEARQAGDTV